MCFAEILRVPTNSGFMWRRMGRFGVCETWMWDSSMRHHQTICLRIPHTDSTWFSWEHPSWLMPTGSRRARKCKGFRSLLHCLIVRQTPNSGFPSRNIRNVGLAIPTRLAKTCLCSRWTCEHADYTQRHNMTQTIIIILYTKNSATNTRKSLPGAVHRLIPTRLAWGLKTRGQGNANCGVSAVAWRCLECLVFSLSSRPAVLWNHVGLPPFQLIFECHCSCNYITHITYRMLLWKSSEKCAYACMYSMQIASTRWLIQLTFLLDISNIQCSEQYDILASPSPSICWNISYIRDLEFRARDDGSCCGGLFVDKRVCILVFSLGSSNCTQRKWLEIRGVFFSSNSSWL